MKSNAKTIGVICTTIKLFLIAYFAMALNLLSMFPDIRTRINMIVKAFRPFVSVAIPVYNIVGTLFCLLVLGITFIMAIAKSIDLDVEIIAKFSELKPMKRRMINNLLFLAELALIWLAWNYGAHYMAFLDFALMITGRLYSWAYNRFIEAVRDKAVETVVEGRV
jgi:hypothetical protein